MDKDFESIRSKVLKLQALCGTRRERRSHKRKAFVRPTVSQIRCFVGRNSRSAGRKTTVHFQRKGKRVRIYLLFTQCYFNVTNEKRMSYRQRRRYVTVELTKNAVRRIAGFVRLAL